MIESHQRNKQSKPWLRGHFDTGGSLPARTPLLSTVCTLWLGPSCIVSILYVWKIWTAASKRTNTLKGHSTSSRSAHWTSTASTPRFTRQNILGWSVAKLWVVTVVWRFSRVQRLRGSKILPADSKLLTAIMDMNMNMPSCILSWLFSATSATYLEVSRLVHLRKGSFPTR